MTDADKTLRRTAEHCPRCEASGARMTLLTSMTRYFACGRCEHRWRIGVPQVHEKELVCP